MAPGSVQGGRTMIRALIVDDEPLARLGIRARLELEADVEIVGEAGDGPEAVERICSLKPDLVFLDVQMPGLDGFQVLERSAGEHLPLVVFVTAHDAHAIRAFEIHALDYLLKPYSTARFGETLRRAREELSREDGLAERNKVAELLQALEAARAANTEEPHSAYPTRFTVRDRERILLVRAEEIEAVEAAGNYLQLHSRGKVHLLRATLAEMESQLDPSKFARIHRSTIVNVDRVREIRPEPHGDCDVVLEGGKIYRLSRAYRERLLPGAAGDRSASPDGAPIESEPASKSPPRRRR